MNDVLKAIQERRSVRAFKLDQLKNEDIETILEAGRQAPSAKNGQPWHFTVVQKRSLSDRISAAAQEVYAKDPEIVKKSPWMVNPELSLFYKAPTVIWVSGQIGNPKSAGDCAIALENMTLAAHSLGLNSCIVVSVLPAFGTAVGPDLIKDLGVPAGYEPLYALSLGYTAVSLPAPAPRKDNAVNYVK
ncbi:nitroreductase [Clostridia bacterium]|nr:nitroreductase [Clostridia bacterium]